MHNAINVIVAVGLALGDALDLAGAIVTRPNLQAILCAIDAAGIVLASPQFVDTVVRSLNRRAAPRYKKPGVRQRNRTVAASVCTIF
jgi:hypothetical protein